MAEDKLLSERERQILRLVATGASNKEIAHQLVTSTMEVYDPARDACERRAPLPAPLSAYAMVAFEGRLYVFGGWDGVAFTARTYEYDPSRDAWTERMPMPTARGYACAAAAGGRVYVIGGTSDGTTALAANEEYTVSREVTGQPPCLTRAPLPQPARLASAVSLAEMIHVASGAGTTGAVLPAKYLWQQDLWQVFEPSTFGAATNAGATAVGTQIFFVGGSTEASAAVTRTQMFQAVYTVAVPLVGEGGE